MLIRRTLSVLALVLVLAALALPALAQDTAASAPSSGMITGLRHLHAWTRWLLVVVAVAAIVKLALGLLQKSAFDAWSRRLLLWFAILATIQWVIGLVFFLVLGQFDLRYRWEHALILTLAVALAHMPNRWKRADDQTRTRNSLILVIAVLVLVVVGVALLPQGWRVAPPA